MKLKMKYLVLIVYLQLLLLMLKQVRLKNKIPNLTNLSSTAAPSDVEKKISDHVKYITTS